MSKKQGAERQRNRVALDLSVGGTKTVQDERQVTSIQNITAQLRETGYTPHVNPREPIFGDFTEVEDLHATLNRATRVQQDFMELPANVRQECGHDPVEFLNRIQTPEGRESLESVGMAFDLVDLDIPEKEAPTPPQEPQQQAQDSTVPKEPEAPPAPPKE